MLRRSPRSASALDQTKQELARQESELHDQMEKLQRMIADAPRVAEEVEDKLPRAIWFNRRELEQQARDIPRDRDVVLYCS